MAKFMTLLRLSSLSFGHFLQVASSCWSPDLYEETCPRCTWLLLTLGERALQRWLRALGFVLGMSLAYSATWGFRGPSQGTPQGQNSLVSSWVGQSSHKVSFLSEVPSLVASFWEQSGRRRLASSPQLGCKHSLDPRFP